MQHHSAQSKVAIFPGTFDPITLGHLDIIDRGRRLFDRLIVALGVNPQKEQLLPVAERLRLINRVVKPFKNVSAEAFEGLTVDFVKRHKAAVILRGLRNLSDMDFEFRLALTNRKVSGVETIFIMTREDFGFTSSSLIKEMLTLGGDPRQLHDLLPRPVVERLVYYRDRKLGIFGRAPRDSLHSF